MILSENISMRTRIILAYIAIFVFCVVEFLLPQDDVNIGGVGFQILTSKWR